MRTTIVAVAALLILATASGIAQSLADAARQEDARRKSIKQPSKVYTNADVKPGVEGPAAETAPAKPDATSTASGQPPKTSTPAPAPAAEDPKKDEKYWRDRITSARAELDRSKVYLDALQSRINALSTDFVNRDDPAQRAVIEADRKRALAELERLKSQIQLMTKGIADIEEEARRLGVPPGWLR